MTAEPLSRHSDAKRTLWDLAGRLAEAGEPEHSKLACLVHFAWQEAHELEQRAKLDAIVDRPEASRAS